VTAKEDEDNVVGGWYETMRPQASAISASGRGRKLAGALARKQCFQLIKVVTYILGNTIRTNIVHISCMYFKKY
jgi:hypothetical protein